MLWLIKQGELMILIQPVHKLSRAEDTTANDNSQVVSVPAQIVK